MSDLYLCDIGNLLNVTMSNVTKSFFVSGLMEVSVHNFCL